MLQHIPFMRAAIEQGKLAQGKTGDNPNVGAVVVKQGQIIGQGFTQPPGQAHAEVSAIRDCESRGLSAEGSTVYVTVEPCAFFGRTPPCANLLVEKRVSRVVIGIRDPHPRVNGAGILILKEAGIEVEEGVCAEEIKLYLREWLRGYSK